MKKNYYKAMAVAIAMGLAATPSVSFAAEMENGAVNEASEEPVEGVLEESGQDGEENLDSDAGWDSEGTEDAKWEEEDPEDAEWDVEDTDEDWEDGDIEDTDGEWDAEDTEEDWEEEDTEDAEWDVEDTDEDWEDGDIEDTEDAEWDAEDTEDAEWDVEDADGDWEEEEIEDTDEDWEDGDTEDSEEEWFDEDAENGWYDDEATDDDWESGSDKEHRKWAYDCADDADNIPGSADGDPADPADPAALADPSCETEESEAPLCQKEAVPEDKTPYAAEGMPAAGGTQNAGTINTESRVTPKHRASAKSNPSIQAEYAASKDNAMSGVYQAKEGIKLYSGAGEKKPVLAAADKDTKIYCYGYYTEKDGENWLYVEYSQNGSICTGFCKASMLKRQASIK